MITIVYNGAHCLQKAIDSVVAQEYSQLEYIVVDGGSTDDTLLIIEQNKNKISKWISEPDEGISDAFNKGISMATGQLIGLLNADDQYAPGALQALVSRYENEGIYYGKMQLLQNGIPGGTYSPNHELLARDMTLCHPATFVCSSVYQRLGTYRKDFRFAMDYEFLLRCSQAGIAFNYIDQTLALMADDGVSNRHWEAAFDEVQRARKMHLPQGSFSPMKSSAVKMRRKLGHALSNGPLKPAVAAYHRWFSLVRKK